MIVNNVRHVHYPEHYPELKPQPCSADKVIRSTEKFGKYFKKPVH